MKQCRLGNGYMAFTSNREYFTLLHLNLFNSNLNEYVKAGCMTSNDSNPLKRFGFMKDRRCNPAYHQLQQSLEFIKMTGFLSSEDFELLTMLYEHPGAAVVMDQTETESVDAQILRLIEYVKGNGSQRAAWAAKWIVKGSQSPSAK